jgi:biotin transport system substrate-specific component
MQATRALTLADAVIPRTGLLRDAALVVGFALFTAIAAQISFTPPAFFVELFARLGIPIQGTPVPITGQTLAVGITGAALGSRRGMLSLLLYLLAGMAGLPVYAGTMGKVFSGEVAFGQTSGSLWSGTPLWAIPSGGYIVGFVVAAYVIGWLAERRWDRNLLLTLLALFIGNVIIYLFGLPWLYWVLSKNPNLGMDLAKTLNFGLWPFIPGDVLKALIAAGVLPGAWALVRRSE